MKRGVGVVMAILGALGLAGFAALSALSWARGAEGFAIPELAAGLGTAGIILFVFGLMLAASGGRLPENVYDLESHYQEQSGPVRNCVWEATLGLSALAGLAIFAVTYFLTLKGAAEPVLGGMLLAGAVMLVLGLVSILFFVFKQNKSIGVFVPGLVLYLVNVFAVAMVVIFGGLI